MNMYFLCLYLSRNLYFKTYGVHSLLFIPGITFLLVAFEILVPRYKEVDDLVMFMNSAYFVFKLCVLACFFMCRKVQIAAKIVEFAFLYGIMIDTFFACAIFQGFGAFTTSPRAFSVVLGCLSAINVTLIVADVVMSHIVFAAQFKLVAKYYLADYVVNLLCILLASLYEHFPGKSSSVLGCFLLANVAIESVRQIWSFPHIERQIQTFFRLIMCALASWKLYQTAARFSSSERFVLFFCTMCLMAMYIKLLNNISTHIVKAGLQEAILGNVFNIEVIEQEWDKFQQTAVELPENDRLFYEIVWHFRLFEQSRNVAHLDRLEELKYVDSITGDSPHYLKLLKYYIVGEYNGTVDWFVKNNGNLTYSVLAARKIRQFSTELDEMYNNIANEDTSRYIEEANIQELLHRFSQNFEWSCACQNQHTRYFQTFWPKKSKPEFSIDLTYESFLAAPNEFDYSLSIYSNKSNSSFPTQIIEFLKPKNSDVRAKQPKKPVGKLPLNLTLIFFMLLCSMITETVLFRKTVNFSRAMQGFTSFPVVEYFSGTEPNTRDVEMLSLLKHIAGKVGAHQVFPSQYNAFNHLTQYQPNWRLSFTYFNIERQENYLLENYVGHFARKTADIELFLRRAYEVDVQSASFTPTAVLVCSFCVIAAFMVMYSKLHWEFGLLLRNHLQTGFLLSFKGYSLFVYFVSIVVLSSIAFLHNSTVFFDEITCGYGAPRKLIVETNNVLKYMNSLRAANMTLFSDFSQENEREFITLAHQLQFNCAQGGSIWVQIDTYAYCYVNEISNEFLQAETAIPEWKTIRTPGYACYADYKRRFGLESSDFSIKEANYLSGKWALDPRPHSFYQHILEEIVNTAIKELQTIGCAVGKEDVTNYLTYLWLGMLCAELLLLAFAARGTHKIAYLSVTTICVTVGLTILTQLRGIEPASISQQRTDIIQRYQEFVHASYLTDDLYESEFISLAEKLIEPETKADEFVNLQICMIKAELAGTPAGSGFDRLTPQECSVHDVDALYDEFVEKSFAVMSVIQQRLDAAVEVKNKHRSRLLRTAGVFSWVFYCASLIYLVAPLTSLNLFAKSIKRQVVLISITAFCMLCLLLGCLLSRKKLKSTSDSLMLNAQNMYEQFLTPVYLLKMYQKFPSNRSTLGIHAAILLSSSPWANGAEQVFTAIHASSLQNNIKEELILAAVQLIKQLELIRYNDSVEVQIIPQLDTIAGLYAQSVYQIINYHVSIRNTTGAIVLALSVIASAYLVELIVTQEFIVEKYIQALQNKIKKEGCSLDSTIPQVLKHF